MTPRPTIATMIVVSSIAALLGLLAPIITYVTVSLPQANAGYYFARIVGTGLSVAVGAFAASFALFQYHRNSADKRIERSMTFWQRANSDPFKTDLAQFVRDWIQRNATNESTTRIDFASLVHAKDDKTVKKVLKIEHILDFYDEACTAVLTAAADERAMYFYLGPVMVYHAERLRPFIEEWRTVRKRPERWDCLTVVAKLWYCRSEEMEKAWQKAVSRIK